MDPAIGEAGDIDTSLVMLTFENGVVATVDNSRKATYGYDQRVEIFGSKVGGIVLGWGEGGGGLCVFFYVLCLMQHYVRMYIQ